MDLTPGRLFGLGPGLVRAAATTACLLVLAAGGYLLVRLLALVAPVTLAVLVALLLTALISPVTERLKRFGVPKALAALAGVLGLLALLGGALYLIGWRAFAQLGDLRAEVVQGTSRLRQLLAHLPGLNEQQLDRLGSEALRSLRSAVPTPIRGAATVAEVFGATLLSVILLFFFLRDGPDLWRWLVRRLPPSWTSRVDRAGRAGWHSLSAYTHGVAAVAAVDAIGIGTALFALRVPLALSLALLTFVAAFVPIVGATVAGVVATVVTLVTNGPRDALLVLAAVIAVQQAEAHLLQPIVMRHAVRLHPVVTLVAVGAGTLIGGIAGALLAVPVCAVAYHATLGYRFGVDVADGGRWPDQEPETPSREGPAVGREPGGYGRRWYRRRDRRKPP
ncbi:AI-2E family transporter [Phytohabitans kaempferiae]|uniref:AI-2E family transporter n=1 Tax=Phytohabitans kaempferiae TaxID=1620943 RepID=A0ABV6M4R7_9ACTN